MRPPLVLVATCGFEHLWWVADRLKAHQPDRRILVLAKRGPAAEFYREQLTQVDAFVWWPARPPKECELVAPLMSAGRLRLKWFAWRQAAVDMDYRGQSRSMSLWRVARSMVGSVHPPPAEWQQFAAALPFPSLGNPVLLCGDRNWRPDAAGDRRLDRLLVDSRVSRPAGGSLWKQWTRLRTKHFDSAVIDLQRQSVPFQKKESVPFSQLLLPRLLGVPRIVVSAGGDHLTELPRPTLGHLLLARYRSRPPTLDPAARIAVFQTEHPRYLEAAVRRLRSQDLHPHSTLLICCRNEDAARLQQLPGVEGTVPFPGRREVAGLLQLRKSLRRFSPDFSVALFTGRPIFRPAKLLFLALGGRQLQVFNARLDLYRLTPATLPRLRRRDELLADLAGPPRGSLLLIQTAASGLTRRAAELARDPGVAGVDEVTVLCPAAEADRFETGGPIDRVIVYRSDPRRLAQLLGQLSTLRPTVVGAVLTGEPIFRKQKLLFWLLPARHRLAFNRHLDCGFVSRWSYRRTLGGEPAWIRWSRTLVKGLLYVPRYAYLVTWVTFHRCRAIYTRTREE